MLTTYPCVCKDNMELFYWNMKSSNFIMNNDSRLEYNIFNRIEECKR